MTTDFRYPAVFEPGENPDVLVVSFPDVPGAITEGHGVADAMDMAAEALGLILIAMAEKGTGLPTPSPASEGQIIVSVAPELIGELRALATCQNVLPVGPIPFVGPAVDRANALREDEDAPEADLQAWYAAILAQNEAFAAADEEAFKQLEARPEDPRA